MIRSFFMRGDLPDCSTTTQPLFLFALLFFSLSLNTTTLAQLSDDFSDGDFSSNPSWTGDENAFTVNDDQQLQLNAPEAGRSTLFTPVSFPDSVNWSFYFKLDFAPSGSNQLRVYLQAESSNFEDTNGYFIEIGESGSDDAVRFFRQEGDNTTLLASAGTGLVGSKPAEARLDIRRNAAGSWEAKIAYDGATNFSDNVQFEDDTFITKTDGFFGFACKYTSSNVMRFFFDDVSIRPIEADLDGPLLLDVQVLSFNELSLTFDEPLDELSATNTGNYSIDNGIGNPSTATLDASNPTRVHLVANTPFQNTQRYEITVTESKDQRGNVRNNQTFSVLFVLAEAAEPFDVVINEIMADPNPALGLPATEFVEIYNRSDKIIDLQTLTIASGGTPQALPAIKLFPNSFAIVCDNSDEADFLPFGTVAAVSTFPSLSDNGDEVLLSDQDGTVIHFVSYLPDWYQDTEKAKGGWTLELISHQRPCVQNADNWIASDNLSGGTPGAINSVNQDLPDNESPGLLSVFPEDEQTLLLSFNEALDGFTAEDATNYSLSNGIEVLSADLIGLAGNVVQVNLAEALQPNQRYELRISTTFTDCVGNAFDESQLFEFGLPEQVLPNDLVINEVLFNPYTGGVDFVELYNKSDKIINTGSLIIGNFYDGASSADAIQSSTLLFPGAYLAISTSPIRLASFYTVGEPRTLLQNPLPAFSNDVGNVTLAANNGVETIIIDAFDYDKEFHLPLLNDLNGVSLERIDPFAETQNADNWQSAARLAGFATPGYQNSQFIDRTAAPANNFFSIENSTFSPDEDGFEDVLLLHFEADQAGYSGSIRIFDAAGRQVRSLIENEPMGTRSSFKWDGSTDQNTRARLGIYVIWMEIFDLEGQVQQFREVCVVAGKL